MKRDQFKFFHDLRVRYAEVDSQGIVFNAHYLTYFDTVITEYMRNIHYDYYTLVSRRGLDFHLIKSTVEYLKPIGFDEIIEIGVTTHKIGKSSLTWVLAIFKRGGRSAWRRERLFGYAPGWVRISHILCLKIF